MSLFFLNWWVLALDQILHWFIFSEVFTLNSLDLTWDLLIFTWGLKFVLVGLELSLDFGLVLSLAS